MKLQRTHVMSRNIASALSRNQTGPSHAGPGAGPGAQEQQRAQERRAEHVRVLANLNERELHARVLDAESRDQLRLRFEDVERHAVLRRDARDDERDEAELAEHGIEHEPEARAARSRCPTAAAIRPAAPAPAPP